MADVEQREIVANEIEHRLDRRVFERRAIRLRAPRHICRRIAPRAKPDRLQIVAGIKSFGNFADVLAEPFAIPEVQRPGERIDLSACIIEVIFLGHAEARRLEHPREAVADHRPSAVADVHRPGRVGRDIFDVDPLVLARVGQAVVVALTQDCPSSLRHASGVSRRLMKPGPATSTEITGGSALSLGAIASARARGLVLAPWPAPSPHWSQDRHAPASRGGSTVTPRRSVPSGSTPSAMSSSSTPSRSAAYWAYRLNHIHRCWKAAHLAHDRPRAKAEALSSTEPPPRSWRA